MWKSPSFSVLRFLEKLGQRVPPPLINIFGLFRRALWDCLEEIYIFLLKFSQQIGFFVFPVRKKSGFELVFFGGGSNKQTSQIA